MFPCNLDVNRSAGFKLCVGRPVFKSVFFFTVIHSMQNTAILGHLLICLCVCIYACVNPREKVLIRGGLCCVAAAQ